MRRGIGRQCISLLMLIVVIFLCIFIKDKYLTYSWSKSNEQKANQKSAQSATASSANFDPKDDAARATHIVDSLPEFTPSLPLKFGFELLKPERPTTPATPTMSIEEAETTFYKYIQTLQVKCPEKTRIGRKEDGGWDACITGPYNISEPCIAYSIGMGPDWTFDYMITDKHKCLDMAYDPSLGKDDHIPRELLWYFNTGLGGSNTVLSNKWKIRTFQKLLEINGHVNTVIDILKIDIEYWEWVSLEAILQQPNCLRNVKQLMIEFHTKEKHGQSHRSTQRDFTYYWHILRGLDRIGFKTWHYLPTPSGHYISNYTGVPKRLPCCANVYFVNTALISRGSTIPFHMGLFTFILVWSVCHFL